MLKHGEEYVRIGLEEYEKNYQLRRLNSLKRTAASLGFELVQQQRVPTGVS